MGHSLSDGFLPLRCALIRSKRQCKIPRGGIHSAPPLLHFHLRIGKLAAVQLDPHVEDPEKKGSEQEFDRVCILGGLLESDEFGIGDRHALSLQ